MKPFKAATPGPSRGNLQQPSKGGRRDVRLQQQPAVGDCAQSTEEIEWILHVVQQSKTQHHVERLEAETVDFARVTLQHRQVRQSEMLARTDRVVERNLFRFHGGDVFGAQCSDGTRFIPISGANIRNVLPAGSTKYRIRSVRCVRGSFRRRQS